VKRHILPNAVNIDTTKLVNIRKQSHLRSTISIAIKQLINMSSDPKAPTEAPSDPPPSFQETMAADPPIFKTQFACITFNLNIRLRFINFPGLEVVTLKETIKACWEPGVAQTRPYGESTEMFLRGTPWMYNSNGTDDARLLLLVILEGLFDMGWVLQGSMDVIKKSESKGKYLLYSE
jgi:hypothetical protein